MLIPNRSLLITAVILCRSTVPIILRIPGTRTINIQYKTAVLAKQFGLNKTIDAYPVNDFACDNKIQKLDRVNNFRKDYHISEITATNTDGMRYVFGLPVYNHVQKEVSFTLDKTQLPNASELVTYNSNASWGDNGRDGFYESTELPPYVTSHLLTAVLSPDYIDVDNNGPWINDVGNYVKINYSLCRNIPLADAIRKRQGIVQQSIVER